MLTPALLSCLPSFTQTCVSTTNVIKEVAPVPHFIAALFCLLLCMLCLSAAFVAPGSQAIVMLAASAASAVLAYNCLKRSLE